MSPASDSRRIVSTAVNPVPCAQPEADCGEKADPSSTKLRIKLLLWTPSRVHLHSSSIVRGFCGCFGGETPRVAERSDESASSDEAAASTRTKGERGG